MRRGWSVLTVGVVLVALVMVTVTALAGPATPRNFTTHLSVAEEVPEPTDVETNPQGQAIFQLSRDGTELHYRLIVANIENVTAAHIHLGPLGETGPVVVWLYPHDGPPGAPIEGRFSGVLETGVITADNLINLLDGADLSDLIAEMDAGNAYVNVHTQQNQPGEIRGQISPGRPR